MFNTTAKLEFGIAAAALAFAIGLRVAVDEPAGFFILFGIFVAAFLAGLALGGSRLVDRAPRYGPDGPPVGMVTIDRSLVTRPSPWPALTAVAVGILAVGVAVGSDVVTAGVIAVPSVGRNVTAAIVAFCLLSSATYLLNDVRDRDQDRLHPRKRRRPIAAGELSPRAALAIAGALGVGGLALAAAVRLELAAVGDSGDVRAVIVRAVVATGDPA